MTGNLSQLVGPRTIVASGSSHQLGRVKLLHCSAKKSSAVNGQDRVTDINAYFARLTVFDVPLGMTRNPVPE